MWCDLPLHSGPDISLHTLGQLFSTPFLNLLSQLISSCVSLIIFSPLLLWVHSIPHLILTTSWILLNGSMLSPPLQNSPQCWGFYLSILSGSMHINIFSKNNILIQSGITSRVHFLGPSSNFISTFLRESQY